jgi:hypothetical protein
MVVVIMFNLPMNYLLVKFRQEKICTHQKNYTKVIYKISKPILPTPIQKKKKKRSQESAKKVSIKQIK